MTMAGNVWVGFGSLVIDECEELEGLTWSSCARRFQPS